MYRFSKRKILGLLLLLTLLIPFNKVELPAVVRSLILLLYIAGIGYLLLWWVSGSVRAPRAYQRGKREALSSEDEKRDE
jgi:hypothetical protein